MAPAPQTTAPPRDRRRRQTHASHRARIPPPPAALSTASAGAGGKSYETAGDAAAAAHAALNAWDAGGDGPLPPRAAVKLLSRLARAVAADAAAMAAETEADNGEDDESDHGGASAPLLPPVAVPRAVAAAAARALVAAAPNARALQGSDRPPDPPRFEDSDGGQSRLVDTPSCLPWTADDCVRVLRASALLAPLPGCGGAVRRLGERLIVAGSAEAIEMPGLAFESLSEGLWRLRGLGAEAPMGLRRAAAEAALLAAADGATSDGVSRGALYLLRALAAPADEDSEALPPPVDAAAALAPLVRLSGGADNAVGANDEWSGAQLAEGVALLAELLEATRLSSSDASGSGNAAIRRRILEEESSSDGMVDEESSSDEPIARELTADAPSLDTVADAIMVALDEAGIALAVRAGEMGPADLALAADALARAAAAGGRGGRRPGPSDGGWRAPSDAWSALEAAVLATLDSFELPDVLTVLTSVQRAGRAEADARPLLDGVDAWLAERASRVPPDDLCAAVATYAALGAAPPSLLRLAGKAAVERQTEFGLARLALLARSCAELGAAPSGLLDACCTAGAASGCRELDAAELSDLLWALGTAGHSVPREPPVAYSVMRSHGHPEKYGTDGTGPVNVPDDPEGWSGAAGLSGGGWGDKDREDSASGGGTEPDGRWQQDYGRYGHNIAAVDPNPPFLVAAAGRLMDLLRSEDGGSEAVPPTRLSRAVWGLARVGYRAHPRPSRRGGFRGGRLSSSGGDENLHVDLHDDPAWPGVLDAAAAAAGERLRRLRTRSLSQLLWAFATLDHVPAALPADWRRRGAGGRATRTAAARAGKSRPRGAARWAPGSGVLQWAGPAQAGVESDASMRTPTPFLSAAQTELNRRLREGSVEPRVLANVSWSLATLGLPPGRLTRALAEAAARDVGRLRPQEAFQIAWALATQRQYR